LVLYTYLVSGRNENLMQLVQFISYWMAACAVYGISRRIGYTRRASLFSSCVFALLTECLMEATTVQNDMVIAAFIGVAVYFLLAFKETRKRRYLVLAGMGIAIALGTKQSAFLMLPSLAVVSVYALSFTSRATLRQRMADPVVFLVCLAIAVGIFALGAGYLEDYRNFGNFLFPDRIKENIFAGYSIRSILIGGTLNLFRHWFEFLSFDGLPPLSIVRKCQALMRGLPEKALRSLGIDLESPPGVLVPFLFGKMPWADDNVSYWGIFGFALVWVIVLLHAAGITRSWANWVLSIAAIVFVFSISYIVHYTPWDGRYFIVAAVLAVPTLGWCVDSRHSTPFRLYVAFVVLVGCISAYTAIFFSSPKSLFASKFLRNASVFKFDRLGQCTLTNRPYYEPLKKFEELVPKEAVVAVCLPENSFEYPLFGERCTRRIVPAYSHLKGFLPIPKDADYLLYSREILDPRESDIYLGAEWYLRRLIKES
jgi:4-amino-4-deoxy-L-arabinose transferase-like glycosyltransferase